MKKQLKAQDVFKKWLTNFWKGEAVEVLVNQDAIMFYRKFPRAWQMSYKLKKK